MDRMRGDPRLAEERGRDERAERLALSIVIPVYNSAATIGSLIETLDLLSVPGGHEVILVNDGSRDDSVRVCEAAMAGARTSMTLLEHSRNFGEHNAVLTGLRAARGAYIITMDDDFQNPPQEVVRLLEHARGNGHAVVYTCYAEKKHAAWRNLGSRFANWCADKLLDKPPGLYLSSFRCVDAFTAAKAAEHDGPFPYVDGLILQVTQNIGVLQVEHAPRQGGASNYTLRRLMRLWLNVVLNFSLLPLRITWGFGLVVSGIGMVLALAGLAGARPDPGAQRDLLLAGLILLAGGGQLAVLGIIGEYLGRLYMAVGRKPQALVRRAVSNQTSLRPARSA